MKPNSKPQRNRMLARIHALKRDHGLSDEDYRAFLKSITGKESCANMGTLELSKVISAFQGKPRTIDKIADNKLTFNKDSRQNLIKSLFSDACRLGHINDRSDKSLNSFVRRQTGIDAINWIRENSDFDSVIHALKGIISDRAPVKIPEDPKAIMTKIGCATIIRWGDDGTQLKYKIRMNQLY